MPANLIDDSAVELIPGEATASFARYSATLSPEWAVWGPDGGHLAAIAFQAAMAHSRLPRPASFQCQFLATGKFEPVELRVSTLGGGKRAECVRVDLMQGERQLLAATTWMVDDGLKGFEHDAGQLPDVPSHGALLGYQDRVDNYDDWFPIFRRRRLASRSLRVKRIWRACASNPEVWCAGTRVAARLRSATPSPRGKCPSWA